VIGLWILCLFRIFTRLFLIRHRTRATVVAAVVWDRMQVYICELTNVCQNTGWWWLNIETGRKKVLSFNYWKGVRYFGYNGFEFFVYSSGQSLRLRRYCLILNRDPSEIKSELPKIVVCVCLCEYTQVKKMCSLPVFRTMNLSPLCLYSTNPLVEKVRNCRFSVICHGQKSIKSNSYFFLISRPVGESISSQCFKTIFLTRCNSVCNYFW